jgi:predicted O-methyltransferase YrrM
MDVQALVGKAFEIGMVQIETEILALASAVAWLKPARVLEIGSDLGGTFYLWSQIATGTKISVDIPGGRFGRAEAREARGRMASFSQGCRLIDGDSHEPSTFETVAAGLDGARLDFLFIDGDHSEAGVRRDWEMYSPLVRPGGMAAFHDVNDTPRHRAQGCLVGRFWTALAGEKITISSGADWGGIGVVRMGGCRAGPGNSKSEARNSK